MEEVQTHEESADLWMECEEEEQEEQLKIISIHTGPAEELSFSQSSSMKVTSVA